MKRSFWSLITPGGLNQKTDDELMELVKDGHNLAFETLFERHGGKLLGYTRRLLSDSERAEDIAQDVWMKVIRAANQYQPNGHFIAWLFTIARNTSFNLLKKEKDWTELEDIQHELTDENEGLEQTLEGYENLEELKRQIDLLPSPQRAALVLLLKDEMSYEEIAQELGTSVSSVKSTLFRARKSLQSNWGLK